MYIVPSSHRIYETLDIPPIQLWNCTTIMDERGGGRRKDLQIERHYRAKDQCVGGR